MPYLWQIAATYPSAVLTVIGPDGYPWSSRVRPHFQEGELFIVPPAGLPESSSDQACLLLHMHDRRLDRIKEFHITGRLTRRNGRLHLSIDRITGYMGMLNSDRISGPGALLRWYLYVSEAQRRTWRYLERRTKEAGTNGRVVR